MCPCIAPCSGLVEPRRHIPHVLRHYPATWGLVNGVLALFAAMQWVWFAAVVRCVRGMCALA